MTNLYQNLATLLAVFSLTLAVKAQNFQGKAVYMSKTKIEVNLEGRNIPEAQKKMIMERMKSFSEKTFELDFDRSASIYEEQEKLETPGGAQGGMRFSFAGGDGKYYKDVQEQVFVNETNLFGKLFLVKDSLPSLNWQLGSETKKIGNYTCYKATAIRQRDTLTMNRLRRMARRQQKAREDASKESMDNEDVPKDSTKTRDENSLLSRLEKEPDEETITAWFTPEIPVSQGPGPYWGLPGLILEVNDGRTVLLCTQIKMNPEQKKAIEAPKKGKEVSQQEFNQIRADKMEEMAERFQEGDRRGGGGMRIRIGG